MIHHLILVHEGHDLRVESGRLISGPRSIAVETLGSIQCFGSHCRWTQSALENLSNQCPTVLARWVPAEKKWRTFSLSPRARHVNPNALWKLCRLPTQQATRLASVLLWTKVCNQHQMLRCFDPRLGSEPRLKENSFNRILRLEAAYSRFFWPRYFEALQQDLFTREKRRAEHPLNAALNYGYGFLYHAIEWSCLTSGIDPSVGLVHKLRRGRPSLVCDLIEPLRCCVELTVARNLNDLAEPARLGGHFAEMLETKFQYRDHAFRLRSIVRLMVESFIRQIESKGEFHPFLLHARDAVL